MCFAISSKLLPQPKKLFFQKVRGSNDRILSGGWHTFFSPPQHYTVRTKKARLTMMYLDLCNGMFPLLLLCFEPITVLLIIAKESFIIANENFFKLDITAVLTRTKYAMTSFFRGHYQDTLKLIRIFIHSKCYCEFISLYHTQIPIINILKIT